MDPTYPLAPIANFLACILVLLPLFCTSLRSGSWGIAVTSFTLWIAVQSINTGVNAIIWSDNVRNSAPIWCEITTRITYASRIALRACSFIMTQSLYHISLCGQNSYASKRSKKHIAYDLGWTVGLPILTLSISYVIQRHRFEIIEEEGCLFVPDISGLEVLLIELPRLILPLVSALFYCPYIFWLTFKRRKNVNKDISKDPKISSEIYSRVMALGCIDALFTLPLSIIMFISDVLPPPKSFYPGWSTVHANFSTIPTTPASKWSKDVLSSMNVRWDLWINPVICFAFFALFGSTQEARATYRRVFWTVMRPLGLKEPQDQSATLPVCSQMRFGTINARDATMNVTIFTSGNVLHTYSMPSSSSETDNSIVATDSVTTKIHSEREDEEKGGEHIPRAPAD